MMCKQNFFKTDRPLVMGILNITPDSFSDSGQFFHLDHALQQAEKLINEGADILDIGGESTRPNAEFVPLEQELERVIPIIEAIRLRFDVPISIDTYKPAVMQAAVRAGANIINDIYALQQPHALETAVNLNVPVCLMHMQGQPRTMQHAPHYQNVVQDVCTWLKDRVQTCLKVGLKKENIWLDPGFGFGKTLQHNYQLIHHLSDLIALGYPVLVGVSRKSMIGNLLNQPVDKRLIGSVSLALLSAVQGAKILRVHDVQATVEALQILDAVRNADNPNATYWSNI